MRAQRQVDVASARHHARVHARPAVVLQIRSVRTHQRSKERCAATNVAAFLILRISKLIFVSEVSSTHKKYKCEVRWQWYISIN